MTVRFYGGAANIRRDGIEDEFRAAGIVVSELEWVRDRPWKSRPLRTRLKYKVQRRLGSRRSSHEADVEANLVKEVEQIGNDAELAYFPWPYRLEAPSMRCAIATTVHDLNFKYFFGTPTFSSDNVKLLDRRIGDWLQVTSAVVSSRFMADEIAQFYPSVAAVPVVRLASFASVRPLDSPEAERTVAELGIDYPYILCPTHLPAHKNLRTLIAAHGLLREQFPDVRLVLTGMGTEVATGRATSIGTVRDDSPPDVIGLGYVSNTQIDSLIECASVVVNPSLYEAGNGSGLDAWSRGTPVAMSDIPPFTEHLDALGVSAALFDPRDPRDIADKVGAILEDEPSWLEKAKQSKAAIDVFTWERTARGYLDVFDAAYTRSRHG